LYNAFSNSDYSLIGRRLHPRWIGKNSKGSGGDLPGTCSQDLRVATKYHTMIDDWPEIQRKHLEYSFRVQEIRLDILVPPTGLVTI
jgi:hypothetical protein